MSEIKDIPIGWAVEKLGNFAIYQKGKKPKLVSDSKTDICFMPYVNIKAFEKGIVDEYTDGDKCTLCKDGDFLMVWDGARAGYIGKAIKGALGSTLVKINFPGILNEYAYQFLVSKYLQINTNTKGTGIPHVDPNILWNYKFPIPPLAEQQRIVAKIEELFSSLDKGIESLKTAQAQLKVYRQAVLKYAFEGKLTNKNIPEGELPEGWVKLKDICTKIGSGATPKGGSENYKIKGIPLIRSMNIHFDFIKYDGLAFIDDKQAKALDNVIVVEDDVLLNITGASIGRINIAPKSFNNARVNQHVCIIRLDEKYLSKYIKYFIQSPKIQEWIFNENYGVTRQSLTKNMVENILIPQKSKSEQTQIVQEIENRLSICDTIEENIRISLLKAEALRQSIFKKAFEGTLVAQDPNDEPASVLLEKIRVEKEKNQPIKKDQAKKGTK